jgi:ankyrin repeat protein
MNVSFLAKFCDRSLINLLVCRGANPLIVNIDGQTALHVASASNRLAIIDELIDLTQTSLLEIKDKHGRTALSLANHPDITERLIKCNADVSTVDNCHMNPLMLAVYHGQLSIVDRFLIAASHRLPAILDQQDKINARSIFLLAVEKGSIDMCSLLLTHSAIRWDTLDRQRMNIIHIAARYNHNELLQFLCHYLRQENRSLSAASSTLHFYVNAQNDDGKTALHFAAEQGHTGCVEVLLKNDANILITNHLGQLSVHLAIQNGHDSTVALLLQASNNFSTEFRAILARRPSPLISACHHGFVDIVQQLLRAQIGIFHGLDFDRNDERNPLEIAIDHRHVDTVHVLLDHPHTTSWLMPIRMTRKRTHQTPIRDMIRSMPDCAKHTFDRLVIKSHETDFYGESYERTVYDYKYIDDYFT